MVHKQINTRFGGYFFLVLFLFIVDKSVNERRGEDKRTDSNNPCFLKTYCNFIKQISSKHSNSHGKEEKPKVWELVE